MKLDELSNMRITDWLIFILIFTPFIIALFGAYRADKRNEEWEKKRMEKE